MENSTIVTTVTSLDEEFKSDFGITNVIDVKGGSQKTVFIIERNGVKCVLKIFKKFGLRDLRELDIYNKYKDLDGIPKLIEIKEHKGDTIVFEEFIDGRDLDSIVDEYINDEKKISELIVKIVDILTPIWKDGVVHRDLKLSNIIIKDGNNPVVIDFGIAKDSESPSITTIGFQPHTILFAAPEQILADKNNISHRTDFFSLAIIAFYLYKREYPFGNTKEAVEGIFGQRNLPVNLPDDCLLKNAIAEIFKFNPSDRPSKIEKIKKLFSI
jgi:serine/threonine-protein kinase